MTDTSPKAVVLRSIELYNDHPPEVYLDVEKFLLLWSDDCVQEFAATAQTPARRVVGKQPTRDTVAGLSTWLRDSQEDVHEAVEEGARVAVRYTWTGIVTRDVPGCSAGTKLRADGTGFYTVRDGLIVEMVDVMGPILPAGGASS
jgi:ketosteroid isomerase-like protein